MARRTLNRIVPQKNEFDDHFLDVIGNEFKFDHAKGLAEWIKNSADAYSTTARVPDHEQFILLRFKVATPKRDSVFQCVDFVGMTKKDIEKAFKVWGLPTAAKKGTDAPTYGGHGNGGKFYMRQMFRTSQFITFRNGKLNVFGFNEKHQYGFAQGLDDVEMSLQAALKFAGLENLKIPSSVSRRWKSQSNRAGFTVVAGEGPSHFSGRSTVETIIDRLKVHPQARRLLSHKEVYVLNFEQSEGTRLEPPKLEPRSGFEKARVIHLPKSFEFGGQKHQFRSKKYSGGGKLILRTSDRPLSRSGELASLSCVDILGEVGCIGSYRMNELGFLRNAPESEFLYGECEAPFLEDETLNSVTNAREKLIQNPLTDALLEWIRQQIDAFAEELAEKNRSEKKSHDLRQSSLFNQLLDRWKNKFMFQLTSELFGGPGIGSGFGGGGGGGSSATSGDGEGGDGGTSPRTSGKDGGGGAGDQTRRGPRFPRVLLSGYDIDPLDADSTLPFECDERHPPIY